LTIGAGKAPFVGAYRPETALSHFNSMAGGGTWRLAVRNYGGSRGTLHNWSLIVASKGSTSSVEDSALVDAPPNDDSSAPAVSPASVAASETPSVSGQFLSEDGPDDTSATTAGVPSDQVFSSADFMAQLQNDLLMGKRSSDNPVDPWRGWMLAT
jgi:hypothetical protein